jgi:putative hemolysin
LDSSAVPLPLLAGAIASALLGALVAAADAAMGALPQGRVAALQEQAEPAEKAALGRFLEDPSRILGRWLVARVVTTSVAAVLIGELPIAHSTGMRPILAVLGAVLICSTFSEMAAGLARARAAQIGPLLLRLLWPVEIAMLPIALPLWAIGRLFRARASETPVKEAPGLAESEMEYLVEDAAKAGSIEAEPAEMIRNVLDFKDLTARDVMIPRIKMCAMEVDSSMQEVLDLVRREGHSRYPIYRTRIDNVVGILYIKDLFRIMQDGTFATAKLRDILRTPVNFVPETRPVSAVLRDMRMSRQHMSLLVDEYGGVSGLITLEDILERIVGDIRDEYDREEAPIQDLGNGHLLADASVSLADLSAYLGTEIEGDGDYGSLGGLLTHEAGKVPSPGDHIVASGIEFIVRDSDAKKISKVEIVLPPPSSGGSSVMPPATSPPAPPA